MNTKMIELCEDDMFYVSGGGLINALLPLTDNVLELDEVSIKAYQSRPNDIKGVNLTLGDTTVSAGLSGPLGDLVF